MAKSMALRAQMKYGMTKTSMKPQGLKKTVPMSNKGQSFGAMLTKKSKGCM